MYMKIRLRSSREGNSTGVLSRRKGKNYSLLIHHSSVFAPRSVESCPLSFENQIDPMLPIIHKNVETYRELAFQSQDLETFLNAYGEAFLVLEGSEDQLNAPDGPAKTLSLEKYLSKAGVMDGDSIVYAVTRTGRSLFPDMISVGRTQNNDIYINDASLSKFHAFFRVQNGQFFVQDARSTNGSTVNAKKVPPQGEGDPQLVCTGDRIRFGAV